MATKTTGHMAIRLLMREGMLTKYVSGIDRNDLFFFCDTVDTSSVRSLLAHILKSIDCSDRDLFYKLAEAPRIRRMSKPDRITWERIAFRWYTVHSCT